MTSDSESGSSRDRSLSSSGSRTAPGPPDPFFARLAELLPDVDIVVLPPEAPPDAGEPGDEHESRRAAAEGLDRAVAALRRWWPVVVPASAEPATISRTWSPGADGRHVQARAEAGTAIGPDQERRSLLRASRERSVAQGAVVVLQRTAAGLLRLQVDEFTIEVHSPPDVPWWSVSASVPDIDVGDLAVALLTTPPTELPWKQRSG